MHAESWEVNQQELINILLFHAAYYIPFRRTYSGTSKKGLSVLKTLSRIRFLVSQFLLSMQFKPLKKENVSIKDN